MRTSALRPVPSAPAVRRPASRRAAREAVEGYLYILPWAIGFLAFTLGPMLASLYLSFHHYSVLGSPRFAGLENYANAFLGKDPLFWMSWSRTWAYALMFIPTGLTISLVLAAVLNERLRGTVVYRTLFFIPTLIPVVASALLWRWMLQPEVGLVNYLLWELRVPGPKWFSDPAMALPALVMISLWASVGGSRMIIFLAGLQGVPEELYDAASIDGANWWSRFVHVTLPMISPTIFFNLVLGIIGALRVFSISFVATEGGPAYATWFYMLHLYDQAFRSFVMGYASAMAWIFFIVVLVLTLIQFRLSGRWVYYAGEEAKG
ncbi:MAG TPA: sugar ABC transporter permease [Chloroflexota bacterium]|jgi:multiple sugar transport system permease protein|nr:sugar ABC transporter permease [Chloroflexota bacterium]